MHDSKKHTSNALYASRKSVFLCAACELTAVFYQRKIKEYNEKAPSKRDITCGHKEIKFCRVFTLDDIFVVLTECQTR